MIFKITNGIRVGHGKHKQVFEGVITSGSVRFMSQEFIALVYDPLYMSIADLPAVLGTPHPFNLLIFTDYDVPQQSSTTPLANASLSGVTLAGHGGDGNHRTLPESHEWTSKIFKGAERTGEVVRSNL